MMNCQRCNKESKITLPYGPHSFCKEDFEYFFEKRVRGTIRTHNLIEKGEFIAVAVSGGKDSLTTLHMLKSIAGKSNELHAIMVDEGIPGYRDLALNCAVKECKQLEIPYTIIDQKKETGYSTGEIGKNIQQGNLSGTSCSYCGTFRRDLLNKFSLELGADKLATGHNLDDECQSILMNIFKHDMSRLARLGPIAGIKRHEGFVPRIKPLYECPEKEVIAFASFKGIEHYSEECCPFSYMAKRNFFREMVNKIEDEYPGSKFGIIRSFLELKPLLANLDRDATIGKCSKCSMPSSSTICHSCGQANKIANELASKLKIIASSQKGMTCLETKRMV